MNKIDTKHIAESHYRYYICARYTKNIFITLKFYEETYFRFPGLYCISQFLQKNNHRSTL